MGKTNAYECDGPMCDEIGRREARQRGPRRWVRVAIGYDDGKPPKVGAFHSVHCARQWTEGELGRVQVEAAADDDTEEPMHETTKEKDQAHE